MIAVPNHPEFINDPEIPEHISRVSYWDPLYDLRRILRGDDDQSGMDAPWDDGVPMYL